METSTTTPTLALNGVDGATGDYLPAFSLEELTRLAREETSQRRRYGKTRSKGRAIPQGLKEGVDPRHIGEAGWAAVFAGNADPAIREALEPLLEYRRRQVERVDPKRYRVLTGQDGYHVGESKLRFLARHGAGSGPADPEVFPYYVLLVGDPETIPYSFQYQLDVQYAVGRVAFDTPEDYARYAESVVAAEQGHFTRPRRAEFFAVRKSGDAATEMIHDLLVDPLRRQLEREVPGWEIASSCADEATKPRLSNLLGGDDTPALLFTACHGLGYREPHPDQRQRQGALVCQEWKGPNTFVANGSPCFAADDLGDDACPGGLLAFHFACYSAGTPRRNDFVHRGGHEVEEVAELPFVARLPQRLLSHPRGGALAVVGHVDRAWSYSFDWPLAGAQREVFTSTLKRLLAGHPLGSAMEYFNQRYAELECDLADLRATLGFGGSPDLLREVDLWTARNDARNYLVVGDPAVRLVPEIGSCEKALE